MKDNKSQMIISFIAWNKIHQYLKHFCLVNSFHSNFIVENNKCNKSNPSIIEFNNESLVIANRNINAPQHNRFDFITMIYIDSVFV